MKFEINKTPVKRQINTLEKLCLGENRVNQKHDLLNQEHGTLAPVDLLQGIKKYH